MRLGFSKGHSIFDSDGRGGGGVLRLFQDAPPTLALPPLCSLPNPHPLEWDGALSPYFCFAPITPSPRIPSVFLTSCGHLMFPLSIKEFRFIAGKYKRLKTHTNHNIFFPDQIDENRKVIIKANFLCSTYGLSFCIFIFSLDEDDQKSATHFLSYLGRYNDYILT